MPVFRFAKAFSVVRHMKEAFLKDSEGAARGGAVPNPERREEWSENRKKARQLASEKKRTRSERQEFLRTKKAELKNKKRLADQLQELLVRATEDQLNSSDLQKLHNSKSRTRLEILRLKSELGTARERRAEGAHVVTGAFPHFVLIGPGRSGTTFLYRLLNQHPLVEPAAKKELHFFNHHFEEGPEWYSHRFPAPRMKDGRITVTGEATPTYIFDPLVPERMAQVIPQARLISLLRNPVNRSYSAYHKRVATGRETRTFEEVIEADLNDGSPDLLRRGTYVNHLPRWGEFFSDEQMLVLKSEDLFECPRETLKTVLNFLDLPEWEPKAWESGKKQHYEPMAPATRRRLEQYFKPYNERLYEFLGVDLGW